ncbi:uncharacterized protein LOC143933008 [Lithobates pipiens]
MARTGVTNLLLFLALVISTILAINGADDAQCQIANAAGNSTSAFNLTVSPVTLSKNTNYTVHLEGSGNVTVILQALSSSNSVGNWSNGNISCSGSPLFQNPFENGKLLQAQWTSPENVTSVNITAHIQNANGTFIVSTTLSQGKLMYYRSFPTCPQALPRVHVFWMSSKKLKEIYVNLHLLTWNAIFNRRHVQEKEERYLHYKKLCIRICKEYINMDFKLHEKHEHFYFIISASNSSSTTNNSSSSSSSSSTTATTPLKTTSASSAVQTSLLTVALFQIFGLLIITSK